MTDITKPKNLTELAVAAMGGTQEDVKGVENGTIRISFNDEGKKIDLEALTKNTEFKGGNSEKAGNYKLEDDKKKILQGAEVLGQQLIDKAKELKIDITKLPEFKNVDLDLNKDGKIDAKEVGTMLLAASMREGAIISQDGQLTQEFDNHLDKDEMKALLDPKTAELAKQIAKKMLADNGVKIADAQDGPALTQTAKDAGVPKARC